MQPSHSWVLLPRQRLGSRRLGGLSKQNYAGTNTTCSLCILLRHRCSCGQSCAGVIATLIRLLVASLIVFIITGLLELRLPSILPAFGLCPNLSLNPLVFLFFVELRFEVLGEGFGCPLLAAVPL